MCKKIYRQLAKGVAKEMIIQLEANQHKGDRLNWVNLDSQELIKEVHYHTDKLQIAINNQDKVKIAEYAADVANLVGMIMDVEKVLDLDSIDKSRIPKEVVTIKEKPKKKEERHIIERKFFDYQDS
jgi:hypothetical protein